MLRNYLAAAIRNLFRNRAYAAINICGLALGFAAVILIGLFVRDEYSYDRFFPDRERTYRVVESLSVPGQPTIRVAVTSSNIAAALKLDFPEIETTTRLSATKVSLRHGDFESSMMVYWADPNFFRLFRLKTLSGNAAEALSRPDAVVLTKKIARRLFGRDDAVGETVEFDRQHSMHIAAVIEDLPSNTHMNVDVLASGLASFSGLRALDQAGQDSGAIKMENVYTYVRLQPGARVTRLDAGMRGFVNRHITGEINGTPLAKAYAFGFVPLADIHFQPRSIGDMKPSGDTRTLQAMVGIAFLILFVACSNFVSMMTARAARRAIEVGVRKVVGATRRQIIIQFLGECLFYSALALALAIIVVQLTLPAFNGFLQRDIEFDFVRDPVLGASIVGILIMTGLAAGAYPALVLSMFRPSTVLKGIVFLPGGPGRLRRALVIFQFGTLIALMVATTTVHRQTQYAMEDRLHLPNDQIYVGMSGCPAAFADAVSHVPGVRAATCTSGSGLTMDRFGTVFDSKNGSNISVRLAPVDYGFFDLFAVKPLAGRLLAPDHGEDDLLRADANSASNPSIVINESGARALGFGSPQAAVNQFGRWVRVTQSGDALKLSPSLRSQIVGVIPDFSVGSVRDVIEPTAYYIDPSMTYFVVLKLDGHAIPQTMRAVRALWKQHEPTQSFDGIFLSRYVNDLYADIQRQSTIFSAFAAVALVVASLGLLGLAVCTAERQTREIGLRKVMGASRWDILRLLGWQFTRPVLWANLLAWPLTYLFMQRWLEGFAYHVDQNPMVFVAAGVLALIIALATVAGHALLVARAKPVEALRYE
ncbi:MAG: transporter permease [Gammaproteobacteria bacterium]|nr:transporter permease [Gammaproteobacteria bacterium]